MSCPQVTWSSGMTSGSLDGLTRWPFDGWWLNFRHFDYVSTHLEHFFKVRSSHFWVVGSFWKLACLAQVFAIFTMKNTVISPDFLVWKFCGKAQFPHSFGKLRCFWQWLFHLNKVRRNCCERTCFSVKNLKCFVADCKKGDQSKTAVFQLSCQVLIMYFFFYKMKRWKSNFAPRNPRIRVCHSLQPMTAE